MAWTHRHNCAFIHSEAARVGKEGVSNQEHQGTGWGGRLLCVYGNRTSQLQIEQSGNE